MLVGQLLIAIFFGIFGAIATLVATGSIGLAFLAYSGVGTVAFLVFATLIYIREKSRAQTPRLSADKLGRDLHDSLSI